MSLKSAIDGHSYYDDQILNQNQNKMAIIYFNKDNIIAITNKSAIWCFNKLESVAQAKLLL